MKKALQQLSEALDKLGYSEIWGWGNKISGGHGFWGSYQLLDADNPKDMVRAWVDALRELGYSDVDVILYGDWNDGRHIADSIVKGTKYDQFKAYVMKNAQKDVEMVREENRKNNRRKVHDIEGYMGIHGEADDEATPPEGVTP
jgi:hypothetical protein